MDLTPIVNIKPVERDRRLATQPLPILVDEETAEDIRNSHQHYDGLLASLLTFDLTFFRKHISPSRFERCLNDPVVQAVLATRNEYAFRLARVLDRIAESCTKKSETLKAARYLQDAIYCYENSRLVPVVEQSRKSIIHYSRRIDIDLDLVARILELQQKRLGTATAALCSRTATDERRELLRHAVSAAGYIVGQDSTLISPDQRATRLAELLEPAFSTNKSIKSDIIAALTELVKALVYGVAASALWELYKMYTMMNPSLMSYTEEEIRIEAYRESDKRMSNTQALANVEGFDYDMLRGVIFELALGGDMIEWLGENGSALSSIIQ